MLNSTFITVCAAATLMLVSDVNARESWEKHGVENGIVVFTATEAGSNVPSVKAVAVVNAPTEEVWQYITESMQVDGLKMRRNLGSCGDGCDYVYVRMGNWMITDRHYVAKVKWTRELVDGYPKYVRVWNKTADKKPLGGNAIVVSSVRGSWTLEPIQNGKKTRITYINHLDLGGNVPPSIFSKGFVSNAYDIIKAIKKNA
ncbi:MAG: hypothetical protein JXX29_20730 [Deltaproteobacteria bacterium]|nr:hypothetical protein [Deltaproteobacteria bacterium]MBN2674119.1 hypothetical protein [Deltaproteobacteria bacterium]